MTVRDALSSDAKFASKYENVLARYYFRNGLKPYTRTRTVTPFKNPSDFLFTKFPPQLKVARLCSSLVAFDCKQSQPLLKSAPPLDESQPHKHSNEKKKDVHTSIFSVFRHIIQIDLFARVLSSNYQSEIHLWKHLSLVRWKTQSAECGVWKRRSVENVGCGKYGLWKMRSVENAGVENAGCGKCIVWKMRSVENA